jgi:hypothetical protein
MVSDDRPPATAIEVGSALCRAMRIDPLLVTAIAFDWRVGELATITVTRIETRDGKFVVNDDGELTEVADTTAEFSVDAITETLARYELVRRT